MKDKLGYALNLGFRHSLGTLVDYLAYHWHKEVFLGNMSIGSGMVCRVRNGPWCRVGCHDNINTHKKAGHRLNLVPTVLINSLCVVTLRQ
jgi:hypothetical protein